MAVDMIFRVSPDVAAAENASPTDELGVTGLMQFHGHVEEAYLPELRYPLAYDKFNEMQRRDPTIASLINAIKLLSRTATWSVEPASSKDADKRAAEFLEQCIGDMSITIEDAVEDMLSAIPFGWYWAEVVYKRRNGRGADPASKYDDQYFGWRKFAPRRQSSLYRWEFDEGGGVQGMWQTARNDAKLRYQPIQKSLHFVAQRDMGNPEGISILEPVYESWHYVKNLQIINGIGFERAFVGLPVFGYVEGYEPTTADKNLVADTGKKLRVDEKAFVALPANITFDLKTVSHSNATSLLDTIKQYRIWMLMTVLADFLALGTLASGGSYSLGQDKSELFLMAVDGWLDKIAHPDKLGVLNKHAVSKLFDYNTFEGMTDYPRLKHSSVQKPNLPALSAYLSMLSTYITPDAVLEADLRRVANLPKLDEATQRAMPQPTYTPPANSQSANPQPDTPQTNVDQGTEDQADLVRWRGGNRELQFYQRQFAQALRKFEHVMNEEKE